MTIELTRSYEFLAGVLFMLAVASVIYLLFPVARTAMRWTGFACAPLGPGFEQLYMRDSWQPVFCICFTVGPFRFGIEDFILAASVAAIGAGVSESVLAHTHRIGFPKATRAGVCRLMAGGMTALGGTWLLTDAGVHSMHAQFFVVFGIWFAMVASRRPRWIGSSLVAALVMAAVMGIFYTTYYLRLFPDIIDRWWIKEKYWGLFFGPLPVEEFLWGGICALYCGTTARLCFENADSSVISVAHPTTLEP